MAERACFEYWRETVLMLLMLLVLVLDLAFFKDLRADGEKGVHAGVFVSTE
ncbi:hypothetical protein BerOc1_02620 [Pseudodesulfovibrio hydrargyri]|uniref:Uncharacterized protein n=1 Tax=Pseudodesulfovibrio hydrargyri TaxID=2125990 RepID=A0A1J5NBT5_9BACT|nr:hypothetical protein [Pseudodesulfovibrio hydrargyri]OIQ50679.1 hypothetical protein BerOc1_02620 [Pseudodesulfovibrio hydrargyri]